MYMYMLYVVEFYYKYVVQKFLKILSHAQKEVWETPFWQQGWTNS